MGSQLCTGMRRPLLGFCVALLSVGSSLKTGLFNLVYLRTTDAIQSTGEVIIVPRKIECAALCIKKAYYNDLRCNGFQYEKETKECKLLVLSTFFFSSLSKSQPKVFHNNHTTRAICPPTIMSDSLRAFWTFTGTTSKNVLDISGKGQHGNLVQKNSLAYNSFSPGKTASPSAMYLRIGDWIGVNQRSNGLTVTDSVSMCGWFKQAILSYTHKLFSWYDGERDGIEIGISSYANQLYGYWTKYINRGFRRSGGRTGQVIDQDYAWHFLCYTLEKSTGTVRVYSDNVLVSTITAG